VSLDVLPAGPGKVLDAVHYLADAARGLKHGQLALAADLVFVRLHAEQETALAGGHGAAEIAQLVLAGLLQLLHGAGDAGAHLLLMHLPDLLQVLLGLLLGLLRLLLLGLLLLQLLLRLLLRLCRWRGESRDSNGGAYE
jgi:hypothetical protein